MSPLVLAEEVAVELELVAVQVSVDFELRGLPSGFDMDDLAAFLPHNRIPDPGMTVETVESFIAHIAGNVDLAAPGWAHTLVARMPRAPVLG